MEHDQDKQIARLSEQLRDNGVAPERDLWPDISAKIDASEHGVTSSGQRPQFWRVVAIAATVLIMVGVGLVSFRSLNGPADQKDFGTTEVAQVATGVDRLTENTAGALRSDRDVIEQAMREVTAALEANPGNGRLSRLENMLYQSHGDVLRRSTSNKARWGWTS